MNRRLVIGHNGHWGPVVVEFLDCRFERLLSENARSPFRPRGNIGFSTMPTFDTKADQQARTGLHFYLCQVHYLFLDHLIQVVYSGRCRL
jgi:hypothetical protein